MGKDIKRQLELYHDDFIINIAHETGRKEVLNKEQYRKLMSDIIAMNSNFSLIEEKRQITRITKKMVLVNLYVQQKMQLKNLPEYKLNLYQTLLITSFEGKAKILRVSSMAKKV